MCKLRGAFLILLLCFYSVHGWTFAKKKVNKDAIGFPETEENQNLKNKENRQPVFLPSTCPPNELYYPGDQNDDWICDCRPAFIYHPGSDACWPAYRRGPCAEKEYLTLPPDSVLPVCTKNPCNEDMLVMWKGKCEQLGSMAPCSMLYPPAALAVNATKLEIKCERLNLESRFGDAVPPTPPPLFTNTLKCDQGCRRSAIP